MIKFKSQKSKVKTGNQKQATISQNNYISSSCSIHNSRIYKNGDSVYENAGTDISSFLISSYKHFAFEYPKFYKMDNLSKLGWLAAEILLGTEFKKKEYRPEDVGVILSNSSASLDTDKKYFDTVKNIPSPALFVYTLPNIMIGEICIRNNFRGENGFFVFEQFDPNFIEQYAGSLINNNILQACICGWVEVLKEDYKAVLFFVEKNAKTDIKFNAENMSRIFQK